MLLQFERDPTFRLDDYYDLTKDQQRERVMTRVSSRMRERKGDDSKFFR